MAAILRADRLPADRFPAERIVDCHVHVIGDGLLHPYASARSYEPRPAPLDALIAMHERWHIDRGVLVQVSVHGTDNSLLLDALRRGGGRYRGVAVVGDAPGDAPGDAGLAELEQAGIVGLRLNLAHGGGPGLGALDRYGGMCREMGWHLQVFAGSGLRGLCRRLTALGVELVFDHFGGLPASSPTSGDEFRTLLALVRDGAWVKLSAPYRISSQQRGFGDTIASGRELLRAAPGRCVWGSDWPHVAVDDRTIDIASLLDLARSMAEAGDHADALLSGNARRLYGFDKREELGDEPRPAAGDESHA